MTHLQDRFYRLERSAKALFRKSLSEMLEPVIFCWTLRASYLRFVPPPARRNSSPWTMRAALGVST